jgi:site-specific recombinase XerD
MRVNGYRPRTVADYCFELSFFRRFLESETDIEDIDAITHALLHAYAAWLYDRGLAAATLHHKLAVLRSFFTAAYEEKKVYIDLRPTIHLPRISKRLPAHILSEAEIGTLFNYLEQQTDTRMVRSVTDAVVLRNRAMVEVLYSTGIRRSELLQLRLADIDYSTGVVFINQGKGGKDRVVPIGNTALSAVQRYVSEGRPLLAVAAGDVLFVTRRGRMLSNDAIRQVILKVCRAAGLEKQVRVRSMRHSCATHMLDHGADIRYVQELLGHASLSSTQIYTHVSINKLKETHAKYHPRGKMEEGC